ncbi:hypothetical protein AB4Y42_41425 [Paraburkholderia sp. EG286B]|uniref:hypothetical protein n=1 Tax=Paraburkholderia sp. EG286B TaxID=3237011 RepID=UPI0034D16532
MSDRRIVALELSARRRQRLDDVLRGTLQQQREGQAQQVALCAACRRQADSSAAALLERNERLDALMGETRAFSVEALNEARRYLERVAELHHMNLSALERQQAELVQCDAAIARTRQQIAGNRMRIDLVKDRASRIQREIDNTASDAADDEAQENAVGRMLRARSVAA